MKLPIVIVFLLHTLNSLIAADFVINTYENATHIKPDLRLIVEDREKKFTTLVHSDVMRKSLIINHALNFNNKVVLKLIVPCLDSFKKVLLFLYGNDFQFDTIEDLIDFIFLEELLQIEDLDNQLIDCVNDVSILEQLEPHDIAKILRIVSGNHTPFGNKCAELLLKYISEHHDKKGSNCARDELAKELVNEMDIVNIIDKAIDARRTTIQLATADPKAYNKARLIKNYYSIGDIVKISKSIKITYSVITVLQQKYQINSEIVNEKRTFLNNKYRIKIIN
jgi:hypothetical protein